MAEAQDAYDHLPEIKDAGWSAPADHPDLVPLTEAAQLEGLLRAMVDDPMAAREPPDFIERLLASTALAQALEDGIAAKALPAELTRRLSAVNNSCKSCHVEYRDTKNVPK